MFFLELDVGRRVIRRFGAMLCDVIYGLIADIYQLFITVARLNILSSDQIAPIYQRITMILTIVMTFYITFEFVKYTIQPDTFTDKEKGAGNILQRIIIVIVLIAFTPQLFGMAYKLQNRIIETQLISKVILGTGDNDYTTYGNEFSANMLNLFYYVDESACSSNGGDCTDARKAVEDNLNHLRETGDSDIVAGINLSSENSIFKETSPAITFNGFLAIIVGGFIVYILAMYSIDVGTRYAQLIFLQIISPIAVMGDMLPKKDGIFQKWGKQCITTYIDLFLRIAIISFVLLIIKVLGDGFDSGRIFDGIEGVSGALKTFTYIVLVMGLLAFAQRAPKLLGELFPSMGAAGIGMGLSAKNRLEPTTKAVKGAYKGLSSTANMGARVAGGVGGAIAGAIAGTGVRGRLRTAFTGAKEGVKKDNKGLPHRRIERALEAAKQRRNKEDDIARNAIGMDREEAIHNAMYHRERYANEATEQDRKLKLFDVPKGSMDAIMANVDEFKHIKAMKQEWENAKSDPNISQAKVKTMEARYKAAAQTVRQLMAANGGVITQDMLDGKITFSYDELDESGFKIGENKGVTLKFDSGDANFGSAVNTTEKQEFLKIKSAADQMKDIADKKIELTVNGVKETKSIADWLAYKGKDASGREITGEEIYAQYVHKFKDAMVAPKTTYETDKEFVNAHAFKDGVGDNGGSKK